MLPSGERSGFPADSWDHPADTLRIDEIAALETAMSILDVRLLHGLSIVERDLDAAAERGDRFAVWRKQRHSELECGMDPDALAVSMDDDPGEWLLELAVICTTPDNDRKILKLDDIRKRLVELTLKREETQWRDS
jgi:hypothetical protein